MNPLATIEQLEARLGKTLADPELGRAEALIDDATTLVRAFTGRTWVDASDVPDARLVPIICAMVRRALNNPDGYSQQSVGSWSGTLPGTPGDLASGLYLTDNERRTIAMLMGSGGLVSVPVERPDFLLTNGTVYVPVAQGGDWFPFLTEGDV